MKIYVSIVIALLVALPCFGQERPLIQVKPVTHAPVPTTPSWYPTGWSITNIRENATDNTNLFAGIGRKLENGWMEFMVVRQYSVTSSQWFGDFRMMRRLTPRMNMQVELMSFLESPALYHFARVDYRMGPLNLMAETENIQRTGKDYLSGGLGIGLPARKLVGPVKFAPAAVFYLRADDRDFVRFYLAFPF